MLVDSKHVEKMSYEELLKKARSSLPESVLKSERFEVPRVRGHVQGNKTIISNFFQIAGSMRRRPEHMLKFLLRELATPGEARGELLVLGTRVHSQKINEKIKKYADEYVLCKSCKKPDTKLEREGDFLYLVCQACGAKKIVRG